MEKKQIVGFTAYKGLMLQQHDNYAEPFTNLILNTKPKRILEIGTGTGGLTLFLREKLNELGFNDTYFKTYDVNDAYLNSDHYDLTNLEILKDNLFIGGNEFILDRYDLIQPYIQSEGVTIVMCDGGNKIKEFNQIAPLLKSGDIIMAHDYAHDDETFKNEIYDKIWNWCEIQEKDIIEICNKENLEDYMKSEFNQIVWACKIKK